MGIFCEFLLLRFLGSFFDMRYHRNDGMLDVAIRYLESGETVFYAVGLAHLLNNHNGLVDALRAAGYTVELVEFAR